MDPFKHSTDYKITYFFTSKREHMNMHTSNRELFKFYATDVCRPTKHIKFLIYEINMQRVIQSINNRIQCNNIKIVDNDITMKQFISNDFVFKHSIPDDDDEEYDTIYYEINLSI